MRRYTAMISLSLSCLMFAGSGCGDRTLESLQAKNRKTGEVKAFSAMGEVPDGWSVCNDPACEIPGCGAPGCEFPGNDPCLTLRPEECSFFVGCRLEALWCDDSSTEPPVSLETKDASLPPELHNCVVQCVSAIPQVCEEITDAQMCSMRPECEWLTALADVYCPMDADCDPPAPASFCQTKRPQVCEDITDEQLCSMTPGCEVSYAALNCIADATECGPIVICRTRSIDSCEQIVDEFSCVAQPGCEWSWGGKMDCPEGALCDPASFCQTKRPQVCEDITDEKLCSMTPGCEASYAVADCIDNATKCGPFFLCTTKRVDSCEQIVDEKECSVHPECEWLFTATNCMPDANCDPVSFCRAKAIQPCPMIGMPEPKCEGELFPIYDENGCVISYECGGSLPLE